MLEHLKKLLRRYGDGHYGDGSLTIRITVQYDNCIFKLPLCINIRLHALLFPLLCSLLGSKVNDCVQDVRRSVLLVRVSCPLC